MICKTLPERHETNKLHQCSKLPGLRHDYKRSLVPLIQLQCKFVGTTADLQEGYTKKNNLY